MNRDDEQENHRRGQLDPEDLSQLIRRLTQSARIEGQRAWLELLRDREEWNAAPGWAQDEAIRAVAENLGDPFEYQNTQSYECGGQRHRIAQFEHNATNIALNLLPGGSFEMGGKRSADEQPIHSVRVRPLLVGVTPVTQAQWRKAGVGGKGNFRGDALPVEGVNWDDIQTWLAQPKVRGRLALPSESEWEYFCRAGTTTEYYFGDDGTLLNDYARFLRNSGGTTKPVAGKEPNAFGLFDVLGNVFEWCQDHWHDNYDGAPTDGSAWTTEHNPAARVSRGGCWVSDADCCNSAFRGKSSRTSRFSFNGFRLCLRLD